MSQATELIARQMAAGANIAKIWGDILYNVKAYGAAGNGTTDDTAAVQATIDYAISVGGKAIFFPHGTYKVTTLTNLSSVVLFGDNASFSGISDTISQIGKSNSNLVYNAKDYGAKGDGTTIDTTAIQAAINAVVASGSSNVYFPPGSYVASGLTNIALVNFVGDGSSFVNDTYNIFPYGMQGKNQRMGKGQQSGNLFVSTEGTRKEIADIDMAAAQFITGTRTVAGVNYDRVWALNCVVSKHIDTADSFVVGLESSMVNETNDDTDVIGMLSSYIGTTKGGQAAYSITGLIAGWNYGMQIDAVKQTGTGIVLRDTVVKTYGDSTAAIGMYAGIDFSNVAGGYTAGAILLGNNQGIWAKTATGTPQEILKLGGDNSLAIGGGAHAGYTVLKAGTSGATIQDSAGANFMIFDSGANPIQMIIGGAIKRIEVGAVDSGGAGYRMVRVAN